MRPEIQRARELRRNMSEPEIILWSRLRRLRDRGFPFRRQYPFRGYYLDFVCLSRRLVIEVDGFQHGDDVQADHDRVRDRVLQRHDFRVIRVWAGEVRRNLSGVMETILAALESSPPRNGEGGEGAAQDGWGIVGRNSDSEFDRDVPTLPASRSLPPHRGGEEEPSAYPRVLNGSAG